MDSVYVKICISYILFYLSYNQNLLFIVFPIYLNYQLFFHNLIKNTTVYNFLRILFQRR